MVCRLNKSLYGLRQAPRAWHAKLMSVLEAMGFRASTADAGLFVRKQGDNVEYLLIYVDDILIASKELTAVQAVKELSSIFDVRDLGEAKFFLGMEITRNKEDGTIKLSQARAINDLVSKFNMTDAKTKATPISVTVQAPVQGRKHTGGQGASSVPGVGGQPAVPGSLHKT
jgi:Reverse transcriptase (RNA-dependent DNA polymerase)